MARFLVTINEYHVRDTQVAIIEDAEHEDDTAWKDFTDHEAVVSTFDVPSEGEARMKAAAYAGVEEAILNVYELK